MNNFDLPVEVLLAGTMKWFGAKSADVAHLLPLKKQIGLTGCWPEWMEDGRTSRSYQASMLLGQLLFPNVVEVMTTAEFSSLAMSATFADTSVVKKWQEPNVLDDAWVNLNHDGMNRWALIGVSRNLAVGAIAIEKEWQRPGYSVEYDTRVLVHVNPLRQEFADQVAHLSPEA